MQRNNAIRTEIQSIRRKNLGYICRHPVRFFIIFAGGVVCRFCDIVLIYKIARLIDTNLRAWQSSSAPLGNTNDIFYLYVNREGYKKGMFTGVRQTLEALVFRR